MFYVFDSSALLAAIYKEKGGENADSFVYNSLISTVNITEVAAYMMGRGLTASETEAAIDSLSLNIIPYDYEQALIAAEFREMTRHKGLSLGDRACLALAKTRRLPVLTADRAWKDLRVGVKIKVIR